MMSSTAINNDGTIVGFSNYIALVWLGGVAFDLNTLIAPSDPLNGKVRLIFATCINSRGQIGVNVATWPALRTASVTRLLRPQRGSDVGSAQSERQLHYGAQHASGASPTDPSDRRPRMPSPLRFQEKPPDMAGDRGSPPRFQAKSSDMAGDRGSLDVRRLSRFLPLSVHAARSNLRGALSAKVPSLPPEAVGLVPPPHDNNPQISVPITILRMHYSISATVDEQAPFTLPSRRPSGLRDARCSPALTLGAVNHLY